MIAKSVRLRFIHVLLLTLLSTLIINCFIAVIYISEKAFVIDRTRQIF